MDLSFDNIMLLISFVLCAIAGILSVVNFIKMPRETQFAAVKEWLVYAVTCAEQQLGGGTGALKLRFVYDMFVNKFAWLAQVISFATFSKWVDDALVTMRIMLQNNEAVQKLIDGKTEEKDVQK